MNLRTSALASLFLLTCFATAQTSAPKPDARISALLDNLGKTVEIKEVAISPDATTVAYTLKFDGRGAVDLQPLGETKLTGNEDRKSTTVTLDMRVPDVAQKCDISDLAWAPDSHTLAYVSQCGTQPRQLLLKAAEKVVPADTVRVLTHIPGYVSALRYTPDGKSLSFLFVEDATRAAGALMAMKPPSGVIGVDNLEIQRVATVDLATGKLTQLTPANLHVYEYDWSPDGAQLVYTAAAPPGENNWWIAQLYTQPAQADAKPTSIWKPSKSEEQIAVPRWSPGGKQIAFIGGLMSDQGSTGGDIFLIPATGGTAKNITPDSTHTTSWIAWESATQLATSEIVGGSARFKRHVGGDQPGDDVIINSTNILADASFGSGEAELSVSIAKNGSIAVVRSSFSKPPEVWAGDPEHPKQITHLNDSLKPAWGKAESINWNNEGYKLQGWLLYPLNYDAAKKYPLIVAVHGGPASAVLPAWPRIGYTPIAFSTLDYFVFMPNPRGSYGQGEKFTAANRKDFGYGDLRDILAGLDAVEKSHNIDDHRIGLTGWSYGGFMTMFAVTQTQRFKAAVAGAGLSNWQSYYGENSIDQWMVPYFGATVYDDPAVYAKSSAINFIHQAKTPTLVVVGDRDGECPAPQSFEFWHALRAQGTPTELVVYSNEGHHFIDPAHQRDVLTRALQWFEQYMP